MAPPEAQSTSVAALPYELWTAIFAFLPEPNVPTRPKRLGYASVDENAGAGNLGWLTVASVCKGWREIALSQTSRPIPLPLRNKPETVQLFSSLDPLPFEVHVADETANHAVVEALDFILDNAGDRLFGFTYSNSTAYRYVQDPDDSQVAYDLDVWFARMETVSLRKLNVLGKPRGGPSGCIMRPYNPPENITLPKNLPALQEMVVRNCTAENLESLEESPLRSLKLISCPNTFPRLPPNVFARLEQLYLEDISLPHPTNPMTSTIHTPNLKELELQGDLDDVAAFLCNVNFPVHASVVLSCGYRSTETKPCPLVAPLEKLYSPSRTSGGYFSDISFALSHWSTTIVCNDIKGSSDDMLQSPSTRLQVNVHRVVRGRPSMAPYRHSISDSLVLGFCKSILSHGEHQTVKVSSTTSGEVEHSWMPAVTLLQGVEKLSLSGHAAIDLYSQLTSKKHIFKWSTALFPKLVELNFALDWDNDEAPPADNVRAVIVSELSKRDPTPIIRVVDSVESEE